MKKHTLLLIALMFFGAQQIQAQQYFVSSLATPGSATFSAGQDENGVITLPFGAATRTIEVQTNQEATVTCNSDWCQASLKGNTLTLTVTQNDGQDARNATLVVRSKDFHPLTLTIRQESRLVFAVISDTHVGNNVGVGPQVKVPQALRNLTARGPLDALAVVGDLTDNGSTDHYSQFVKIFGSEKNILNPVGEFLFMMGNHDNYNADGKNNYQTGLKSFNQNKSYPYHQYRLIKGYPFITLSDFGSANNDLNDESVGTVAYPKTTQYELEKMLKKAAEEAPGKPIFVFTHVAPRWTCYSAWPEFENGEAWCMKVLNPILNKYPQVVVFAGHSHYPLGDPRSIHQGSNPKSAHMNYYTTINTASTTYSEIHPNAVDAGIHPEGYEDITEGMIIVELPEGDIEIHRYDTYRNVEIDPDHPWVLKAPFDGSMFQYADIRDKDDNPNNVALRDGLPAPAFTKSAELTLAPTDESVKITFPQATDNECVFRYNVSVLKGKEEVKSGFVFSQFYLNNEMPSKLSYMVEGLEPNTEYTAKVVAYDSYDNKSVALTKVFTTLGDDAPVPEAVGVWTFDDANNLLAGTGKASLTAAMIEMGVLWTIEDLAYAGITPVEGPLEGNGAIKVPVGFGLKMITNLEEKTLNYYTLMFDIRSEELSGYTAIFQNDITNQRDGSFFIKNGQLGLNSNGLGYSGQLTSGKWHRVLFVVKNNAVTLYLDGKKIGQSTSANATKWQMSTGALFFLDDNGEEHNIETAEIRFWDMPLSSKQAAKLGNATDEIPEVEPIPDALGTWTFDNAANLMEGTGTATLSGATHANGRVTVTNDLAAAGIVPVTGPSATNGAITLPVGSSLLMDAKLGTASIGTYTIMLDIKVEDGSTYIPLLQNSLTNSKDGSLFINKNMVGLGGQLGYHGKIENGKWYRVVFVVQPNGASLYVDGQQLASNLDISDSYNRHWLLTTGALFFADDNGEEKAIETAEIRFWNTALNYGQVEQLGKVK